MSEDLPLADELSVLSARVGRLLLSEETVAAALDVVVRLIQDTVTGTDGAGVTLVDQRGRKTSSAASSDWVREADALQYDLDEGPCLDSWARREIVRVDDLATERRWPRWTEAVRLLGLRASLSAPLLAGEFALGAIKVYAQSSEVFDEHSEHLLSLFGSQASVFLAHVQSRESADRVSEELRDALRSRDVIGTAKGILMAREGLDEETAFASLVSLAQRDGRRLRDVAQDLVRSTRRSVR